MSLSKYSVVRQIGQGQYGQIFLATARESAENGQQFAIKRIENQPGDAEHILLPQIQHPNIIKVHEILREEKGISMVLQYASQGDLAAYVRKNYPEEYIPEKVLRSWLLQLCLTLYHLHHELSLIHRDIKTINVLVMDNGLIKLSDFGLGKKMNGEEDFAKSTVGTPYYLSPETVNAGRFNIKSDVWGLGCLMYELCTGEKPFKGTAYGQIFNNIVHGVTGQLPECYSKWLSDLIKSMLEKSADKRPTVESILEDDEMRKEFTRLKDTYKEYEGFSYPALNLKTTKYLERQEKFNSNLRLFSESLKTTKKEKPIKMQMSQGLGEFLKGKDKQKKVQRTKFADKSLRSLLDKRDRDDRK